LTALQNAKYDEGVRIVTRRHLKTAATKYPDAAAELAAWSKLVEHASWRHFSDVRATFWDADGVDEYVVFNLRHSWYRLITIIHYCRPRAAGGPPQGHVYIRSFLTHAEYNKRSNWNKRVKS
jgi:mRNA interferase HigB